MRRRTFLEIASTALTATAATRLVPGETANAVASIESIVLELERKWVDAMVQRDEATLRSLMADDFRRIEKPWPNVPMFKPQWVENTVRFYRIELFKYLGMSVRVSEKNALVTLRYRWRGAANGAPFNETVSAEDTWEQSNGRWQVVSRFVSSTEKAGSIDRPVRQRKAIKLDPSVYLAYVGQYQFGESRILTISQEGKRLVHQGSGGHRAELLPDTKTRFFRKDVGVLTTFVKNKNGQVTHVVHRHTNGRESIAKRIA